MKEKSLVGGGDNSLREQSGLKGQETSEKSLEEKHSFVLIGEKSEGRLTRGDRIRKA